MASFTPVCSYLSPSCVVVVVRPLVSGLNRLLCMRRPRRGCGVCTRRTSGQGEQQQSRWAYCSVWSVFLSCHGEGSESSGNISGEQSQGFAHGSGSEERKREMTWKICSILALHRLSDARSVATEALRTADFTLAVPVVMCSRQRLANVDRLRSSPSPLPHRGRQSMAMRHERQRRRRHVPGRGAEER